MVRRSRRQIRAREIQAAPIRKVLLFLMSEERRCVPRLGLKLPAVLATIWYIAKQPDSAKIAIEAGRPGRNAVSMSVPQTHAAIGPIRFSRVSGPIRFAKAGVAIAAPSCVVAISRPAATGPAPSLTV